MLILLVGEYKTGKTVSSCTFPKPLLYLDFDDGLSSVYNAKDKLGKKIVEDTDKIKHISFYKNESNDLTFRTAQEKGGMVGGAPPHTKASVDVMKQYNQTIKDLENGIHGEIQTVVIDSLTAMFRMWKEALMATNGIPALRIADYMTLEQVLFNQFIPTLKTLHKKIPYIILIDHVMMDKDEISGRIIEFPVGPSQNMGKALGKEFDEIWYQQVEGGDSYLWRTRKFGFFQAGSRLALPDPIKPATFQELSKYVK